MNQRKSIHIIVPLHGFEREQALSYLLTALREQDDGPFQVTVVEQEKSGAYHTELAQNNDVRHIRLPDQPRGFNKAWCVNAAVRSTEADGLIIIDVDMMFDRGYIARILKFLKDTPATYITCWDRIMSLPGRDSSVTRLIIPEDVRTAGGIWYIDRHFFWDVGGMNENYFAYGGEDNDMWARVNSRLGPRKTRNVPVMPYTLVHWYHDWASASEEAYPLMCITLHHIDTIIERLKAVTLGRPEGPTEILMKDLPVTDAARPWLAYEKGQ